MRHGGILLLPSSVDVGVLCWGSQRGRRRPGVESGKRQPTTIKTLRINLCISYSSPTPSQAMPPNSPPVNSKSQARWALTKLGG